MADALSEQLEREEDCARRIAEIMGPASSAAKALDMLDKARAKGLQAVIFREGRSWVVANRRRDQEQSNG